mgnify:CR=1 FL=1
MSDKELKVQEVKRFVVLKNSMVSEVRVGKTLFLVTSKLNNPHNSFMDVIGRIAQRQIDSINRKTG